MALAPKTVPGQYDAVVCSSGAGAGAPHSASGTHWSHLGTEAGAGLLAGGAGPVLGGAARCLAAGGRCAGGLGCDSCVRLRPAVCSRGPGPHVTLFSLPPSHTSAHTSLAPFSRLESSAYLPLLGDICAVLGADTVQSVVSESVKAVQVRALGASSGSSAGPGMIPRARVLAWRRGAQSDCDRI